MNKGVIEFNKDILNRIEIIRAIYLNLTHLSFPYYFNTIIIIILFKKHLWCVPFIHHNTIHKQNLIINNNKEMVFPKQNKETEKTAPSFLASLSLCLVSHIITPNFLKLNKIKFTNRFINITKYHCLQINDSNNVD